MQARSAELAWQSSACVGLSGPGEARSSRHDIIFRVATEVPIVFGIVARSSVDLLLSKIAIFWCETHCRGWENEEAIKSCEILDNLAATPSFRASKHRKPNGASQ